LVQVIYQAQRPAKVIPANSPRHSNIVPIRERRVIAVEPRKCHNRQDVIEEHHHHRERHGLREHCPDVANLYSVCVCVYVCVCVCVCLCVCVRVCTHTYVHTSICMYYIYMYIEPPPSSTHGLREHFPDVANLYYSKKKILPTSPAHTLAPSQ
jgi:hypothetical protein